MPRYLAFATLLIVALAPSAQAQDTYPNHPITFVVGFAAGGTSDIVARLLGRKISEYTGTAVVIENIPGAASNAATEKIAHATPDGYTPAW
jgi:tripartite-type tricarboxylate transporter receptor subunit TctC